MLSRYARRYPLEATVVDRFRELLAQGAAAFYRDHPRAHFTASALVFDPTVSSIVLTHHRKLNIWIQLGGHADGEADLAGAARREALEESGLTDLRPALDEIVDLDIHPIPAHRDEPEHEHYDVRFAFIAPGARDLTVSDESHDLAWVPVGGIGDFSLEESLHRAVRKAVGLLRA
jgi:8-oxo-dGTP pyrophosphatase MutT (NUDIX family)